MPTGTPSPGRARVAQAAVVASSYPVVAGALAGGFAALPVREHQRVRATLSLIVIALGLGLAVAAGFGALIWFVSSSLHHAANN